MFVCFIYQISGSIKLNQNEVIRIIIIIIIIIIRSQINFMVINFTNYIV